MLVLWVAVSTTMQVTAQITRGKDPQLERAVKEMQEAIKNNKDKKSF